MQSNGNVIVMENHNHSQSQTKYNVSAIVLLSLIMFITLAHAIFFVCIVLYVKDNANTLITNIVDDVEKQVNELANEIVRKLQAQISNQLDQLNVLVTQQQSQQLLFALRMTDMINEIKRCACNVTTK